MIIPLQISMLFNDIFVLEIQTVIFDVKKPRSTFPVTSQSNLLSKGG